MFTISCVVLIVFFFFFFLMIRRPPRSTLSSSSAASDVYKRQVLQGCTGARGEILHWICVFDWPSNSQAVPPTSTSTCPPSISPVMVIRAPPAKLPRLGEMLSTLGAASTM
eukprot:TRINITY_DN7662_c0_g1_i10.p3 TRINITY_DN7662_c0_g1~~TRINITY_DN7662_c0_g1_i10.p3  ORF type:complete len:111 (+),score=39.13 TRINITY_DN7662_c0_g1_i10:72-404(+)